MVDVPALHRLLINLQRNAKTVIRFKYIEDEFLYELKSEEVDSTNFTEKYSLLNLNKIHEC